MNNYSKDKAYQLFLNHMTKIESEIVLNEQQLDIIKKYCDLSNSIDSDLKDLKFDKNYYKKLDELKATFTYKKITEGLEKVNLQNEDWFYQCVNSILEQFQNKTNEVANIGNKKDDIEIKPKEFNDDYLTDLISMSESMDVISDEEFERLKDFNEMESFNDYKITIDGEEYKYMDLPLGIIIDGEESCPYSNSTDIYVCYENPRVLASFESEKPFRSAKDY